MSLGIRAAVAVSAARRRKHFWNQRLKESVAKKNRANAWLRWLATKADPDLACSQPANWSEAALASWLSQTSNRHFHMADPQLSFS
jgi:hypothetical protein